MASNETDIGKIHKPESSYHKKVFSFVGRTGYFLIAGLFIPGFTAIIIVSLQMLLTKLGVECPLAFKIVFTSSAVSAFALPYLFIQYFSKVDFDKIDMSKRLLLFNLIEYIFIQAGLSSLFSSTDLLCYGHGGQNGLEVIFVGWLALPILILLSWRFDVLHKKHLKKQFETVSQ